MENELILPDLYLNLLKEVLTRSLTEEPGRRRLVEGDGASAKFTRLVTAAVARRGWVLARRPPRYDEAARAEGRDYPPTGETMVGHRRLENLQACIKTIIREDVPGDLVEAGVWRGGASIFMRAALTAYGDGARVVWAADSFEGLPRPDPAYPADEGDRHWERSDLAVSQQEVERNFTKYGLLDDRVRFLKGWFRDTLPAAPIDRIALIRADGDMYESTMDILRSLEPKVSSGGYVVIDDYGAVPACRQAVDEYRAEAGISAPLQVIDWTAQFWRKG